MRLFSLALAALLAGSLATPSAEGTSRAGPAASAQSEGKTPEPSDAQIRRILIDESIAAYPGSCPCPYSRARNGSVCGRRSAYSRPGGEAPLCYAKDVSDEMVREYRASRGPATAHR